MTNEEAIKELQEDIELYIPLHGTIDDVDRELPDGRLITALEMAIKSLEAWEKVKAEIDQKQYDFMADKDYDEGVRFGLMLAYQIIDKYIESEVPDADRY